MENMIKEQIAKISDEEMAKKIFKTAFIGFTKENFSQYQFLKICFIQILSLQNNGLLTEDRAIKIDEELGKLADELLGDFMADWVIKKDKKKGGKR